MKLYTNPVSTVSRAVGLFIADHNIPVEEEVIDLMTGAQLQEPYASINPNCLVPMLEDGDFRLSEASAILKYLADKFDSPAYPKDLQQRAVVNERLDWLNSNFYKDFGYGLCYPQLFPHHKRRSDEAQNATIEWGKEKTKHWLGILNDHWIGPDHDYLCGNKMTLADYFGSAIITLGDIIHIDLSPYPNVERWLNNMRAQPNWNRVNEVFNGFVASMQGKEFVTLV